MAMHGFVSTNFMATYGFVSTKHLVMYSKRIKRVTDTLGKIPHF